SQRRIETLKIKKKEEFSEAASHSHSSHPASCMEGMVKPQEVTRYGSPIRVSVSNSNPPVKLRLRRKRSSSPRSVDSDAVSWTNLPMVSHVIFPPDIMTGMNYEIISEALQQEGWIFPESEF